MAEDPQREIRRAQLKKEKETLSKAQDWLADLMKDTPEVDADPDPDHDQDIYDTV